ncbi:MAG: CRISPR-associated protein Csx20 [Microscillaceae bacterium]|nr:CRISPR-associated protein Csx20 [Microscillaceae bacterium]
MKTLHLLFSHTLTPDQEADAKAKLQIGEVINLPEDLQKHFSNVPSDLLSLEEYAQPLMDWLLANAQVGDFALVQGDFGLAFILVNYCKEIGVIPVYSTTERQSVEVVQEDGSIVTQRVFKHRLFRKY